MDEESLTVAATLDGRDCVITIAGDLDVLTAARLAAQVNGVVGALNGQADQVVLDLADLDFLDLGGARALMAAVDAVPAGRRVTVRSISPVASRLLSLLGWSLETRIDGLGPGSGLPHTVDPSEVRSVDACHSCPPGGTRPAAASGSGGPG